MLTPEHIANTERAIGGRLPPAYAARLLTKNGDELDLFGEDWRVLPCLDETDRRTIQKTGDDIVRATRWARESGGPSDIAVIAVSECGDELVLRLEREGVFGTTVYRRDPSGHCTRVAEHVLDLWDRQADP